MPKVVQLEITETTEELKKLIRSAKNGYNRERLQVLYWLKTQEVSQVIDIARLLSRSRITVQRWLRRYRSGGMSKFLADYSNRGRKQVIRTEVHEQLKARLQDAEHSFTSYKEIQQWLVSEYGIKLSYNSVHGLVRYKLKAKLKVARPTSIKHDAEAEAEFKKNCLNG
jgi:transposase